MKHVICLLVIALASASWPAAPAHSTAPDDFLRLDGQQLVVPRTLLGVPLLLLPTLVEGTFTTEPMHAYIQDYTMWAVRFQHVGSAVQLVIDPIGITPNTTTRAPAIVAAFPVRSESATALTIDFHASASMAILRQWTGSTGTATTTNIVLLSAPDTTPKSYLRSSAHGDDWFTMEQVLGVQVEGSDHGAVVRWTFWREEASTLEPLEDEPEDAWGYFSHPRFVPGNTTPRWIIHRLDPARPVTFFLSANTPPHVRPYIRDAVLSWNDALGHEFLRVADAPAGVTAGDPRYPLIQWAETDRRSAVAMARAHPRTGEILTAFIDIHAGWAHTPPPFHNAATDTHNNHPVHTGTLCVYEQAPWTNTQIDEMDPRQFGLRVLQAVIIHEVGHVLGLRHNFAASLDGDDALPASSAMDYLAPADDVRMLAPGAYDRAALAPLYGNTPAAPDAAFHFCTDEDVGTVADCARWDGSTTEPIRWHTEQMEGAAQAVSRWIIDNLIVPADLFDTLRPDQSLLSAHLGRLKGSLKALQSYRTGNAWTLHGLFPYERAAIAQAALAQFLANFDPDDVLHTHPLIREPLAAQIAALEVQAARDDATGRWATQVLRNIVDVLQRALKVS